MFFNNKSQVNAVGSELFAGDDSFMTELQATEITQIVGGYGHGGGKYKKHCKSSAKKSWKKSCETPWKPECPPPAKCPPVYCPPVVYCPPAPCHPC
jgi:hypothetical protein